MSADTSIKNSPTKIDTGRSVISFSTGNMLDRNIMIALKECIENPKVNDVTLCEHLQGIANGTIKL